MIAGEYAVLRPTGSCLAVAVGEVVEVRVDPTASPPSAKLTVADEVVRLDLPDSGIADGAAHRPRRPHGIGGLATIAEEALRRVGADGSRGPRGSITLTVVGGRLGGQKTGVGTSAAVAVAAVEAAALLWRTTETRAPLEAASRIDAALGAHISGQDGQGSGYDIVTISLGGVVAWQRGETPRSMPWPNGLFGVALFTGKQDDTREALRRGVDPQSAEVTAIAAATDALRDDWQHAAPATLLDRLRDCEAAAEALAGEYQHLRPQAVRTATDFIKSWRAIARTSGAGGGDCVLALGEDAERISALARGWQARGGAVVAELPAGVATRGR